MSRDPAERARSVLHERVASIPEALRRFAERGELDLPLLVNDVAGARQILTTGVGSSAAHARFLAHLLSAEIGLPARFVSTGALAAGSPPGAERDALIVFSQGLSPNARFAFAHGASFGALVLVSAESGDGDGERARWRRRIESVGAAIVELPSPDEYGTLIRVVGPMLGLAASLAIARALGRAAGRPELARTVCALDLDAAIARIACASASLDAALPANRALAELFCGEIALVASHGYGELVQGVRTKILEGLLRPLPALWDGLELAHGGHQRLWSSRGTLLHLARAGDAEDDLLARLARASFDDERYGYLRLDAQLQGAAAALEHEAIANALVLRWIDEQQIDPRTWPGRDRDAPLYERSPPIEALGGPRRPARAADPRLDHRTSAELEAALASGARTVVLPLGSIEQHGPHLPLGTDAWIAEWLAERVCESLEGAVRLPALPFGCAPEHMDFSGTLSLEPATLVATLRDLLRSLAAHGFERALVFSAHGGNAGVLRDAAASLREACGPLALALFTDHAGLSRRLAELSATLGSSARAAGQHAGELEASIVAGLAPGALRRSRLEPGLDVPVAEAQSVFYPSLRDRAPNGVVGDPRGFAPERAEAYLGVWVSELLACLEALPVRSASRPK